jgi:hypothetical protein
MLQVPIAARKEIQAASYNLAAQLKAVRSAGGWLCLAAR